MSDERDDGKAPRDDDEARRVIMARRRRFVAVALTSAGVAASSCDKNPLVCLSPVPVEDDTATPSVCLSTEAPPDAEGPDAPDAGAGDAGDGDAGLTEDADAGDAGAGGEGGAEPSPPPRVCLRAPPPPKPVPKPCLKFAPPDVDEKKM